MDLAGIAQHEPVTVDADRRTVIITPTVFHDRRSHILPIKHADHLGEHPGQVSFPGDGCKPNGTDLQAAALHESNEEIGPRPREATFYDRLDDIRTVADHAVSPFVATIPDRAYGPDQCEMAGITILAIGNLVSRAGYESERRDYP